MPFSVMSALSAAYSSAVRDGKGWYGVPLTSGVMLVMVLPLRSWGVLFRRWRQGWNAAGNRRPCT